MGYVGRGHLGHHRAGYTQAELTAATLNICGTPLPAGKTLNGTVANVPTGQGANISFGGAYAPFAANGPFRITNARDGSFNLIAYSLSPGGVGGPDRGYIDPVAQNPANGGSFANPVDFVHPTNSFSPTNATFDLNGTVGGETMSHTMTFYSGTGPTACTPALINAVGSVITGTRFFATGIPVEKQPAGGMHQIRISADGGTLFRILNESFIDLAARSDAPFVLPTAPPVPAVTNAGGPYKRVQAVMTGLPAEYNLSSVLTYFGPTGQSGSISGSAGWLGGGSFTLVLPDFSGLGGFFNAWAPGSGDLLRWMLSTGGASASACQAGARLVTAVRSGQI